MDRVFVKMLAGEYYSAMRSENLASHHVPVMGREDGERGILRRVEELTCGTASLWLLKHEKETKRVKQRAGEWLCAPPGDVTIALLLIF